MNLATLILLACSTALAAPPVPLIVVAPTNSSKSDAFTQTPIPPAVYRWTFIEQRRVLGTTNLVDWVVVADLSETNVVAISSTNSSVMDLRQLAVTNWSLGDFKADRMTPPPAWTNK